MPNNSIVNLGDLSKPADTLIKKISKAVGGIFAPSQTKRRAQAEAEATIIKAHAEAEASKIETQAEIERAQLCQRAVHRFIAEETQRQKNMEDITAKALLYLNEEAEPDGMNNDWIANFFDKCRIVSDSQMQSLWSRILAGEANIPDTYSKRTVNFISELDKNDAELFTKLCGFCWTVENFTPLIFDESAEIYKRHGINFETLNHLDSIGFINFQNVNSLMWDFSTKSTVGHAVHYYGTSLCLEVPEYRNSVEVGKVHLTKIGQELAPICGSQPMDGFYEYVKEQWKEYLPIDAKD